MKMRLKPKYRKRVVLSAVIVSLCVLGMQYEWGTGPRDSVIFFHPSWACGGCPPFLVVTAGDAGNAQLIGEDSRVFVDGEDLEAKAGNYDFFLCQGRFKQSVRMLLREYLTADSDFEGLKPFFDASACERIDPEEEVLHRKNVLMKRWE